MKLRGREERDRAVYKIARPHEAIATGISLRLLSRWRSRGVQFQARQMRLYFQVGSSVRHWAFAIKLGFPLLFCFFAVLQLPLWTDELHLS